MCNLITHSLAFNQNFNTLSKASENSKIQYIRLVKKFSQLIGKIKKFIIKSLTDSINSQFLFDQLKKTFNQ